MKRGSTARQQSEEMTFALLNRSALLLVLVIAMLVYFKAWRDAPILAADSRGYMEVAKDLADLKLDRLHGRTLGYPLLLLLTGSANQPSRALFAISLAFHAMTIWLLSTLLSRAGVPRKVVLCFGFILFLPPYVEPTGYVLTENLATFSLTLGFFAFVFGLFWNPWWLVVSGLAFGFSGLVRPVYSLVGLCAIPAIFAYKRDARSISNTPRKGSSHYRRCILAGASTVLLSLGVVGALVIFNYLKFGYLGVTPLTGFHLCTRTVRVIERLPDKYAPVREALIEARNASLVERNSSHTGYMYAWGIEKTVSRLTGLHDLSEISDFLTHLNLILIYRAPLEYLQEICRAMCSYWFPASGRLANMGSRAMQLFWAIIHFAILTAFSIGVIAWCGVGLLSLLEKLRALGKGSLVRISMPSKPAMVSWLLAVCVIVYSCVLSCAFDDGNPRHRQPTDPLILFATFLSLYSLWSGKDSADDATLLLKDDPFPATGV
jgi:uncharacterized membrane protein YuzA (DUF378 family)